jgi:hypothetical protein
MINDKKHAIQLFILSNSSLPQGLRDKPRLWGRENFNFLWEIKKKKSIAIIAIFKMPEFH